MVDRVKDSALELVGNTPLLRLQRVVGRDSAQVLVKLEGLNPWGSVKDRVALAMVEEAEARGVLRPGYTIVEPTSGNAGISLALVGAAKGYKVVIFMPNTAAPERRRLLARCGVDLRLTQAELGMEGAHRGAQELAISDPKAVILDQFRNQAAVRVHRETTAVEVLEATQGRVDAFVAGVGTGSTLTGVGQRLKEARPGVLIVAVEPASSPLLSEGRAGPHGIPGIGADFVPPLLSWGVVDRVMTVNEDEATAMCLRLAREEAVLAGISSGANVVAALRVAAELGPQAVVVTVLPDTLERYLSFPM